MIRPLRVVALDLSLTGTGIAVTHDQVGEPRLSCRTVTPQRRDRRPNIIDHQRLHEVIGAVMATVACKPDVVVVEWLPLIAGKGDISLRIAELHGAIKHWLWSKGIPYADVRPQEVKTYATGNANADKEKVLKAMIARYGKRAGQYGVHIGNDNEADALSLLALALDKYDQPLTDRDGRVIEVPDGCRKAVFSEFTKWPKLAVA